ncbi:MAG: hypothetical protein E7080_07020 [Bacteroidales bacterium]|nr:hypothetical protein [Bacteroidales bacterium]
MKKHFFKLSFFISIVAFIIASCNNEPAFNKLNENESEKNDLLKTAKEIVQQQNGNVPLPVNGTGSSQSRSAMSVITSGTPLWDYVKYYNIDGMQVLMIELQTAEQVFSRITSTKDGVTSTKEVETFSRLVIRKKGTKLYTHVITYMPESEYAMANQAKLDTIGYYPQYVDFTGITLTSHLDGSIFRGIRYENGHVAGIITKPQHTDCDHDHGTCSHSHHDEHIKPININLFSQSSQEPMSRAPLVSKCLACDDGTVIQYKCQSCGAGYGQDCPNCKLESVVGGMCLICGYLECELCNECGKLLIDCNCENRCPTCENSPCSCPNFDIDTEDICPYCKRMKEYCTCAPDGGSGNNGSSGGINTNNPNTNENVPVLYSTMINSDASFAIEDMPLMMKTQDGMASLSAIMTYIDNELLGGMRDVSQFEAYYDSEFNGSIISTGVNASDAYDFIDAFFVLTTFDTFQFAIEDRYVVVSSFPGSDSTYPHYVLVVGRESDGDLVYIDPLDGEAYLLDETRFESCEQFVIKIIN